MTKSNTPILCAQATEDNIAQAAEMLRLGKLIAFPTETVYGLGACAENAQAVEAIFEAKGRPSHNPLIVHVADLQMAQRYGHFNDNALNIAKAFFPSALTLVVPAKKDAVAPAILAGGNTIALRCPQHNVVQSLLKTLNAGIAAPSANRSGKISATCASHVVEEFSGYDEHVAMILDDGATSLGIESTVIECVGGGAKILRHGCVSAEDIAKIVTIVDGDNSSEEQQHLASPGMLESHYAPDAQVRLHANNVSSDEVLLAFGKNVPSGAKHVLNLSEREDLREAAHNLYDYLRQLDALHPERIAVMPIAETGIGVAINDRLRRAAATRPA